MNVAQIYDEEADSVDMKIDLETVAN